MNKFIKKFLFLWILGIFSFDFLKSQSDNNSKKFNKSHEQILQEFKQVALGYGLEIYDKNYCFNYNNARRDVTELHYKNLSKYLPESEEVYKENRAQAARFGWTDEDLLVYYGQCRAVEYLKDDLEKGKKQNE